jgi:hypothetical protein
VALNPCATGALGGLLTRLADAHSDMDIVFSLRLAETGVAALSQPLPPAPALAVVGPTQTGKSTVVNILAGGEYMETSPLAAHTRKASLLAVNTALDAESLADFRSAGLPVERRLAENDGPPCLIWDTPDFDSNAAALYRQQVARVCALADLLLVVVSKEKYADQSVWQVLETVAPLEAPTIVCLNKCDDGPETGILLDAIGRRLAENPLVAPDITVVTLPLLPAGASGAASRRRDVQAFRNGVFERLAQRPVSARQAGLARLARANWDAWVQPVERELACRAQWHELLAGETSAFLARYRSEYIDHSRHHDVAQKAILGLLELLEIPALAGPIARTRRVLTWPFRRLAGSLGGRAEPPRDKELDVLDAAIDHYLLSLRGEVSTRRHPWWRALEAELARCEPDLKQDFRASIDRYRQAFQPRIDDLSNQLYEQLKQSPATLNALRATRIGADAGGILIAIKTGTLGLYDALFAPAVLSLTSYLTESVVGQYLRHVIAGLKQEQYEQVSDIIRDDVVQPLQSIQPRGPALFGVTGTELAQARAGLEELKQ